MNMHKVFNLLNRSRNRAQDGSKQHQKKGMSKIINGSNEFMLIIPENTDQ
jgi:hypothetical protein